MKKNLLLMLFVSCFGGTSVVNASNVMPQTAIENTIRPMTDVVNPVTIGELEYNLDIETMTASVVKAVKVDTDNDYLDEITVPSTIEYEGNTYTVTALENGAFAYRQYLSYVTLPETLTKIDKRAFISCWALESINLPNSVKSIGKWAFKGCECLLEIHLPDNLEELGEEVFYNCPSLRNLKFNDKLKVIPFGAFAYCRNISDFVLPSKLEVIGEQAFYGCETIANLDVPETVTEIGPYAFGTCISLTNIILPSKITKIKEGTYINCIGLKKVEIPERIDSIDKKAFAYCENLDELVVSKNVEFIGVNAFDECSMSFLTFEDSDKPLIIDDTDLTGSRRSAFAGVEISELYIGRDVQNFYDWSNEFLKKVYLGPNLNVWRNEYCGDHAQEIHALMQDPTQIVPVFDDKIYEKAKLVVPVGTLDAYAKAEGWSKFLEIVDTEGTPAGIEGVAVDDSDVMEYYSVDGVRSNKPVNGLNIVKLNDGTIKKIFIK